VRVAYMGEIRNSYKVLVMQPAGKRSLDKDWWVALTLMFEKWSFRI
jgi:hypothetical protein